jgi:hypothetical protein
MTCHETGPLPRAATDPEIGLAMFDVGQPVGHIQPNLDIGPGGRKSVQLRE